MLIKVVTSEKRGVRFLIKIVCKSINRDAHVTAKVIFVNFSTVIWKTMKLKCICTVQYPSLLIENEKSMLRKVYTF